MNLGDLIEAEDVWRSVEDQLFLSSPECFATEDGKHWIRAMFRYTMTIMAYGNKDIFLKIHKQALTFFERVGLQIEPYGLPDGQLIEDYIPEPDSFPGWDKEQKRMIRGPFWLRAVMERAIKRPPNGRKLTKSEITRMAQLVSCKGFPAPGIVKQGRSLLEHRATVTTTALVSDERLIVIERLAERIGRRVGLKTANQVLQNSEHVSLTNRSSYGSSRSEGGRAVETACHWRDWAIGSIDEPKNVNDCVVGDWITEPNLNGGVINMIEINHTTFRLDEPAKRLTSSELATMTDVGSNAAWRTADLNSLLISARCVQDGFEYEDIPPDRRTLEWIYWGSFNFVDATVENWKRVIVRSLRDAEDELDFEDTYQSVFFGENLAGYNGNVGIQVTQVAFRSLVNKEALKTFLCFDSNTNGTFIICKSNPILDPDGKIVKWNSNMRTACKPETGGKARIFTIQEWDRTIALQPFGHFFIDCLKSLPEASAGLSRENAGWEWANELEKAGIMKALLQSFMIMTNDLDTATDYGEFPVGKAILKGVFKGIGADRKEGRLPLWWHPYLRSGAELLCSGVMIESPPQ